MDMQLQAHQEFQVRQRIRLMVNQYEVYAGNQLVAFAQQKRLAFREQVTLYADDSKQRPVLGFKARQVLDVRGTYDVTDASGAAIGLFRKEFARSLLRTTWRLEQPGLGVCIGQERSLALALLRRFTEVLDWLPYHFDFKLDGQLAFSVVKRFGLRDRYQVTVADPRIDRRLVIAMAVALDALQDR